MKIYVFGYGSLMNPASVRKTLPGKRVIQPAVLRGYQRKINAPVDGYLYLNITPRLLRSVRGVLIEVTLSELEILHEREPGYVRVEISEKLESRVDGKAYTFIAPDRDYPGLKVPRSYLETCTSNMTLTERKLWLKDTIIENEIEEDVEKPVYANVALKDIDK